MFCAGQRPRPAVTGAAGASCGGITRMRQTHRTSAGRFMSNQQETGNEKIVFVSIHAGLRSTCGSSGHTRHRYRCRQSAACRRLGLLGGDDHRGKHLGHRRIFGAPGKELRSAGRLLSGLCQRHDPHRSGRRGAELPAQERRGRYRERCRREHAGRQLHQARRDSEGRNHLVCGAVQDGLLQFGRVVREFGLGNGRLQRRHIGCAPDQDAGTCRHLYADSRREPPDHAGTVRPLRIELYAGHVAQLDSGFERHLVGHGGARSHHGPDQPRTPQADGRRTAFRECLFRRRVETGTEPLDGTARHGGQETDDRHTGTRFDGYEVIRPQPRRVPRSSRSENGSFCEPLALRGRQRAAIALGLQGHGREPAGRTDGIQEVDARGDDPAGAGSRPDIRIADPQPGIQRLHQTGHAGRGCGL